MLIGLGKGGAAQNYLAGEDDIPDAESDRITPKYPQLRTVDRSFKV